MLGTGRSRASGALCFALAALVSGCASTPTPPPAAAPPRIVQAVRVDGATVGADLLGALAGFSGQALSPALAAEASALVADYLAFHEWRALDVRAAPDTDAQGLLRLAVTGAPPPPVEDPPPEWFDIPMPTAPPDDAAVPAPDAPGGARSETALDDSFRFWLDSPARVLIDAGDRRLYLKNANGVVSYPVAVGTARTPTPPGDYWIEAITHKPTWFPTANIRAEHARKGKPLPRAVPPGRGNPLGSYFVRLQNAIGIHGTNQPRSIGRAASHGCIRMHDRDVRDLIAQLQRGDRVLIVRTRPATAVAGASATTGALGR